ncbi:CWF19-like protein 2 [Exaiptasia diaphana]|uniref:CWF19-like protein 2 n=1 Tax=Exaiptasia diaphana TaxID=2652724 RepID=A0A913YX08_EXADI|nr:CWF19-like protein 2 [Exaiptasia diaphana]XP_028519022.1 CWF19-like protein 2 [Exaiptasia diaphana]
MLFPCFAGSSKSEQQEKNESIEKIQEEEQKPLTIDLAGQHSRELNPYWKNGGTGLPAEKVEVAKSDSETIMYDVKWLKKALQRSKEQAEVEGRSLEDVVSDRWGSLERLEALIDEAEKRDKSYDRDKESSWSSSYSRHRTKDRDRRRDTFYHRDDAQRKRHEERDRHYSVNKDKYCDSENKKDSKHISNIDTSEHQRRFYRDESSRKNTLDELRSVSRREEVKKVLEGRSTNPFRRPESNASKSSYKFMKPSDELSNTPSVSSSSLSTSSGGWKKKSENEQPKVNRIEQAMKNHQFSDDSSSDSEDSEDDKIKSEINREVKESSESVNNEKTEVLQHHVPTKKITEADLNNMGAKILKAELMGNEDLAAELKASLEQMRADKEAQESSTSNSKEPKEEEVVVLTRTDKFGNTRPVSMNEVQEPKRGRRKREKVSTHSETGQRERYFADDDRYDLNEIVRREKMNTAEDYNAMFSRLASKGASKTDSDDFTLDDHFVSGASKKYSKAQEEERDKMRAIKEHQRLSAQLSKCRFCFENPDLAKHLIIAIGIQVYLAVPLHTSLTEGHCLIIPMQHQVAYTYLDEDIIDEIKVFKKGLTRMFQEMNKDVIFLETCRNLSKQDHMIVECVPVPKEEGDLAPMYFKKAILESDSEWAHNKKLVDTSKKGLLGSIPKGLPYFSVEFGLDGGFAHVIEEEHLFPHYFGKEIIGGMLDLEPWVWHKPHRENFEQHKKKVLQFADWWKPYDWTKRLAKNK